MQEVVWRIANESSHRHDSISSNKQTVSIALLQHYYYYYYYYYYFQSFDDNTLMDLSRWKYISELSSWLYQVFLITVFF